MSLEDLRKRLDTVDQQIVRLIAERQNIVTEIGNAKHSVGRALRDFAREKVVIEKAMAEAEAVGMSAEIARDILERLIHHSLTNQEQKRWKASDQGQGRRALVIGGHGRMGVWISRFLDAQGFAIEISDPVKTESIFPQAADYTELNLDHDVIVVATPLRISNQILLDLAERKPSGLIFDVGSLKSPLLSGFEALREAGCQVTSIHPMFGPSAMMLSGKHIIFVDVGLPEATNAARALFAHTMADCVDLSLEEHDQTMAWVLGLSHMLNVAFATTLAKHADQVPTLKKISSTTFDEQLKIASNVVRENPHLYYEIQHCNDFGLTAITEYRQVLDQLVAAVSEGNESAFVEEMMSARQGLG